MINQTLSSFRPPPRLTISEWAEQHRYLSPEASAESGKWHNARAPHLVAPMDALSPSHPCQEVILMFPSQDGKTEVLNNFCGYIIDQDPGPCLVVQPNVKPMAEAWSKDRLAPLIRDCPCLQGKVSEAKARNSGNTIGHKSFPGGQISISGANAPAGLASRPIRYLCMDELDRWPVSAGTEGSPIKLAEKRTRRFWNRKILKVSSPSFEGVGIHAEYERSDKREWHLACPDCGETQFPGLRHLQWDKLDGQPVNIRYVCEHCGVEHPEDSEHAIKYSGRWIATRDTDGRVLGFWKNQISSLFITWKETILEWLASQSDDENRQTFINTALAEPYIQHGETVEAEALYGCRETYPATVPQPVQVLTAWFDIQSDRLEGLIQGWAGGEESYCIDYVRLIGDPLRPTVWNALKSVINADYLRADGVAMRIRLVGIDSGYLTDEAYKFSRAVGVRRVIPTKGRTERGHQVAAFPRQIDQKSRTYRTLIGTDTAKETLYQRYEALLDPENTESAGRIHFPDTPAFDLEFFEQATAEEKIAKYRHGIKYYDWDARRKRNEVLDTLVGNLAMIRILQAHFAVKLLEHVPHETPPQASTTVRISSQSPYRRREF